MSEEDSSWRCLRKLFGIFDKDRDGKLNLDDLVLYVAEVRKMGIVEIDEANVVNEMMKLDAEYITFDEFKTWSSFASKDQQDTQVFVDPFGNSNRICTQGKVTAPMLYNNFTRDWGESPSSS
ncbi:hypothetical protein GUITHDRAFT_144059 [Guillardia theta CCMP2712]|uniref:EF-hand domain-containing protein n=1 Tax=Guillardia theta (strain CCMP2712) TaxID=905079 RepID=L1IQV7_GUITC|nr:hypothetical protein GUITHDRAFT_144059 [Guillardia theta CCMP2712]EKX38666.1 hypothetical protein GUITHDRAFT_144059 [Guillardia theta CCMP2712]|eukprot:XP_005825646.1 hypothetical protein GUITHDRAFT_144059 [Guillardia theta CCMP2712]